MNMIFASDHLRTLEQEDGAAVLDMQRGVISTLNETGAYIWQALQRGDSAETIVAHLFEVTGAPEQVVQEDFSAFLENLKQHHLLPN